jgi:pilus assembly protein CpaC
MKIRLIDILLLTAFALCASALRAETPEPIEQIQVGAGKTFLLDTNVDIARVSVAAPEVAEAVPVSPRTVMVNGKGPGETSLILWFSDGSRRQYDVNTRLAESRFEAAKQQIEQEFQGRAHITVDNGSVYLTGTVKDTFASQRAIAIAATAGKVVNLLKIDVPPQEVQILLKVRFADVDRSKALNLGINFFGAPKGYPFSATTGNFGSAAISQLTPPMVTLSDSLNLLFFDPQINVGATLKDLASKSVLQILAEPNVLALNGHEASFIAGGEFPFPTLQGGGSGVGQITIQFRQFGVQIRFLPTVTPRGTIRLHVRPEVSSLDYANALNVSGYTIPALSTRRVDTDIELKDGQTFAIAGLLDQRTTESLAKMPGLADIPVLGKLFTSKSVNRTNSELLVIITPEIVAPIPAGSKIPDVERPLSFLEGEGIANQPPRTPGTEATGPAPVKPTRSEISIQEFEKIQRDENRRLSNGGGLAPSSYAPSSDGGFGGSGGSGGAGADQPSPAASAPSGQALTGSQP